MWSVTLLVLAATSCSAELDITSTYEAFTTSGHRCIGDCGTVWWDSKCIVTWNFAVEPCVKNTNKRTTHYIGLDGKQCISDCDAFGGYQKQWCATGVEQWDYCSRPLATIGYLTVQSNNKYSTCIDECRYNLLSGYWCHTGDGEWAKCDSTKTTVTYNNPTKSGERCITRCKREDAASAPHCYTQSHTWSKCFVNPPLPVLEFGNVSRRLRDECTLWTTSDNGERLVPCRRRPRRQVTTTAANEFHFDCTVDVEDVLLLHELHSPNVVLRPFNPNNPITVDSNPILNWHTIPTISYFSEEHDSVDIPLSVEALITTHTLGQRRQTFRPEVTNNFFSMDVGVSDAHRNFDERGHMIAARLGGPTEPYNIFPQTRWLNHGAASPWFALEQRIENFIKEQPSTRYVRMWVVLSYPVDSTQVLTHRPDAVGVRVRAYDNGQLVDLFTGAPVTVATNAQENLFFSNDPARRCNG